MMALVVSVVLAAVDKAMDVGLRENDDDDVIDEARRGEARHHEARHHGWAGREVGCAEASSGQDTCKARREDSDKNSGQAFCKVR